MYCDNNSVYYCNYSTGTEGCSFNELCCGQDNDATMEKIKTHLQGGMEMHVDTKQTHSIQHGIEFTVKVPSASFLVSCSLMLVHDK